MARIAKQGNEAEAASTSGEQITYRPDPDDPVTVTWARHLFHANVPKMVTNVDLIERARNNRFFHVGSFDPQTDAVPLPQRPFTPTTAEQYRVHAVSWIKTADNVEALDTRWQAEESLRMACNVGADDLEYIGTLFNPKRAELKKRDMPI